MARGLSADQAFWRAVVLSAAVACASAAGAQVTPAAGERQAEPSAAQQAEAESLVKEVFKPDYLKRGPEERKNLAVKLLTEAKEFKTDFAAQYVMLREARDLAAQVGDMETVMGAIAEIGRAFKVDPLDMKLKLLGAAKGQARPAETNLASAEACATLLEEAAGAENFDVAMQAADLAAFYAGAGKNPQLGAAVVARKADLKARQAALVEARAAEVKLKANPNDPAANLAVGLYACAFRNEWDKGLPMLAKAGDPAYAAAAKADLANPVDLAEMIKVADGWWDLANRNPAIKPRLLARAEFWYNLLLQNVDGVAKQRIEKRLEQIAAARAAGGGAGVAAAAAAVGPVSEETKRALPTAKEVQAVKAAAAAYKAGDHAKQGDLVFTLNDVHRRLSENLAACSEADFIARVRADAQLRRIVSDAGAMAPGWGLGSEFNTFAAKARTREELASRCVAFERLNAAEKVLAPDEMEREMESAIRGFVNQHFGEYRTAALKAGLATFLKNKGVKAGVDAYRQQWGR